MSLLPLQLRHYYHYNYVFVSKHQAMLLASIFDAKISTSNYAVKQTTKLVTSDGRFSKKCFVSKIDLAIGTKQWFSPAVGCYYELRLSSAESSSYWAVWIPDAQMGTDSNCS